MAHELKTAEQKNLKENGALAAVLDHQAAIAALEGSIERLESLIAAKREEIAQAEVKIPSIAHLVRAREDLLAAVAIGQASDGDLKKFDSRSEAEKAAHGAAVTGAKQVSEQAMQAISGLSRKRDEALERLAALHAEDHRLLRVLLSDMADQACEKYVAAALMVKEQYLLLMALDALMKSNGITGQLSAIGLTAEINLPLFNRQACQGHGFLDSRDSMFNDYMAVMTGTLNEATTVLKHALRESGVTLF